jgi:hypothetical protein
MKIHTRNTESILYEKVKSLRSERPDVWRCIHLEHATGTERPYQAHFSGRITSDLLADEDGYIYLCDDGDVFILFKGALMPILRKLSVYFEDFRPDRIREADYITVFDLGMSWQPFFELCKGKFHKFNDNQQVQRTAETVVHM